MPHVVTENCIDCKFTDCVEVCPVDSFYEADEDPKMVFIHPEVCIDCGACAPECPVEAIFPDEEVPENLQQYIKINADGAMAGNAINVTAKQDPLPTAEKKKKSL